MVFKPCSQLFRKLLIINPFGSTFIYPYLLCVSYKDVTQFVFPNFNIYILMAKAELSFYNIPTVFYVAYFLPSDVITRLKKHTHWYN